MNYTNEQRRFIESQATRLKLLACPGSGKSATLAAKILKESKNQRSICISYTNAGADEISIRCGMPAFMFFGTLHSFMLSVIRKHGASLGYPFENIETIQPEQLDVFIAEKIEAAGLKKKVQVNDVRKILGQTGESTPRIMVATAVLKSLRRLGLASYETMLADGERLIDKMNPLDCIYVDEAQDFSDEDWRLIAKIRTRRLIVVGDPFQSIFGFRGANPYAIPDDMQTMHLSVSFRCPGNVVKAANALMSDVPCYHPMEASVGTGTYGMVTLNNSQLAGRRLFRYNDDFDQSDPSCSTIHAAKGLEWQYVEINDWITEKKDLGLDEERRLYYVAITRSSHLVNIKTSNQNLSEFAEKALSCQ